jgi:sulfide:quinone oxidoreductase
MESSVSPLELPPAETAGIDEFRVVIAGGGVASLEAILALSELKRAGLAIELLAPEGEFTYRAMSVAQPFGSPARPKLDLAAFCAEHGAELHSDRLSEVWPQQQRVLLDSGDEIYYDALLIALGATPYEALEGALTFRGPADVVPFGILLDEIAAGQARRLAFAVPAEVAWSLPLYELALLTAQRLKDRGADDFELMFVTHEQRPLGVFGIETSEHVSSLLDGAGVKTIFGRTPTDFTDGVLRLDDGELEVDRVVALPGLRVPPIPGMPQGSHGFIGTDAEMRVDGIDHVWAVGDAIWFPIKQGGLAAQQAEVAVSGIAAASGLEVVQTPFRPVVRGALLTGTEPHFMRAAYGTGAEAEHATAPLWWPPAKIAGRRLAPYMARHWSDRKEDPLLPLEDRAPGGADEEEREREHRDALELSLRWADSDALEGEYRQALRWLDVAEKLNLTLPRAYERRRAEWRSKSGFPPAPDRGPRP